MAKPAMAEQMKNALMMSRERDYLLSKKTMGKSKTEIQCDKMRCNAESGATNILDANGRTSSGREVAATVIESRQVLCRATVIAAPLTAVTAGLALAAGVVANRGAPTRVSCRIRLI